MGKGLDEGRQTKLWTDQKEVGGVDRKRTKGTTERGKDTQEVYGRTPV